MQLIILVLWYIHDLERGEKEREGEREIEGEKRDKERVPLLLDYLMQNLHLFCDFSQLYDYKIPSLSTLVTMQQNITFWKERIGFSEVLSEFTS